MISLTASTVCAAPSRRQRGPGSPGGRGRHEPLWLSWRVRGACQRPAVAVVGKNRTRGSCRFPHEPSPWRCWRPNSMRPDSSLRATMRVPLSLSVACPAAGEAATVPPRTDSSATTARQARRLRLRRRCAPTTPSAVTVVARMNVPIAELPPLYLTGPTASRPATLVRGRRRRRPALRHHRLPRRRRGAKMTAAVAVVDVEFPVQVDAIVGVVGGTDAGVEAL